MLGVQPCQSEERDTQVRAVIRLTPVAPKELSQVAEGRLLVGIMSVEQSSLGMRFFSKPRLPQAAPFSPPHKWLPHLLAKKTSPRWNSDRFLHRRVSGGAAAASSFIYQLFIVAGAWPEALAGSLSSGMCLLGNRWRRGKAIQLRMWFHYFGRRKLIAGKVTGRRRTLS